MSLPAAWIDSLFDKLTLTYGQEFLRRWQDVEMNAVKSDWAHELSSLFANPSCIAYALQHLPEKPPTVIEFRRIARSMPEAPALPPVYNKAGAERIAAEMRKLAPMLKSHQPTNAKDWARRIIENDKNGIRSQSSLPLEMARRALR